MQLKPHGNVNLSWNLNLFQVEVIGPFNIEGVNSCFRKIQDSVIKNKPSVWARIDALDPETLGSPDVMKVIGASYQWCLEQDCVGIAVVCTTFLQAEMLEKTRLTTGMNLAAFRSSLEAEKWCIEQIQGKAQNKKHR